MLLVQGELADAGLLLGVFTHEIGLAVQGYVHAADRFAATDVHAELDFRRLAQQGLEDDALATVGGFGETESDI